ncbi:exodeoxyribonuclease VII large subunit [Phycisphaerales bacterium AB-hyl4]|uniref:Exodeoxyribonuclease 7 large subunit n=1 Tax=Natronomicrosphaera hydrolytica TaxID=3242702 RepID=A0ABV4U3L2_9BACT
MGRLPFNPDHVRTPATPAAPSKADSGDQPVRVGALASLIKTALTDGLPRKVRVVGEVSNFSSRTHWFFSLKDEQATIRCVCFASSARRVRFPMADGLEVVATGRVDFFNQAGQVQLYVDQIEPVGQGALELRLRQLIDELREQGYFDDAHKRVMPTFAQRIAVVTSRSAAALQDVINTASKRWPGCQLMLYDVKVQGEAAAPEIAAALRTLSEQGGQLGIDAVLLTRGGGSIEDLWAFNERAVADAVYHCKLPIVAAIGHETDTTVAELVADLRCATPTQAAMRLVPEQAALEQALGHWAGRLSQELRRRLRDGQQRVTACASRAIFRRPAELVERARRRLDERQLQLARALPHRTAPARQRLAHLDDRLRAALPRQLHQQADRVSATESHLHTAAARLAREQRQRLQSTVRHLEAVSPRRVLDRGYSYTLGPDGQVLRRVADVKAGDALTTMLSDGQVRSTVGQASDAGASKPTDAPPSADQSSKPFPSPEPSKGGRAKRSGRRKAAGSGADQPTLFGS